MRKIDMIEFIIVALCLMFAIVISIYHVSYEGFLGISNKVWGSVWAVAENGFSLLMCGIVVMYSHGTIKLVFRYLFIPYFILKMIYHVSCFSGIYLLSADVWSLIWSLILIVCIFVALVYCLLLIKRNKHVA